MELFGSLTLRLGLSNLHTTALIQLLSELDVVLTLIIAHFLVIHVQSGNHFLIRQRRGGLHYHVIVVSSVHFLMSLLGLKLVYRFKPEISIA